jgi:tripeptide aminopeptidase
MKSLKPMNSSSLAEIFLTLLSIPSPSGKEKSIAQYIREYAGSLGFDVQEEVEDPSLGETGNLVIHPFNHIPRQEEPVVLVAHMDTVPVPVKGTVPLIMEEDLIHTGGASPLGADDKAGVALALYILEKVSREPEHYIPFEVVFTVREEEGCLGARHFSPSRIRARKGICLDGETPVSTAIIQSPSKWKYTIQVQGKSAHAALNAEEGINAILYACRVGATLPTGLLDPFTTANLGIVEGGTSLNVVPDRCILKGELRSLEEGRLSFWKEEITKQAAKAIPTRGLPQSAISWELAYPGYTLSEEEPLLKRFRDACRILGMAPQLLSSRGGGDANYFNAKGIASFVLGLGMEGIHTPHERYSLSTLHQAARLLEQILCSGTGPITFPNDSSIG